MSDCCCGLVKIVALTVKVTSQRVNERLLLRTSEDSSANSEGGVTSDVSFTELCPLNEPIFTISEFGLHIKDICFIILPFERTYP
jgi:hypothetical protein